MSIANTSAACSTACLSDTKTRLMFCSSQSKEHEYYMSSTFGGQLVLRLDFFAWIDLHNSYIAMLLVHYLCLWDRQVINNTCLIQISKNLTHLDYNSTNSRYLAFRITASVPLITAAIDARNRCITQDQRTLGCQFFRVLKTVLRAMLIVIAALLICSTQGIRTYLQL